jgi:hypothetical protein
MIIIKKNLRFATHNMFTRSLRAICAKQSHLSLLRYDASQVDTLHPTLIMFTQSLRAICAKQSH